MSFNPVDLYTKPWTGWDEPAQQQNDSGNPFLDYLLNDLIKPAVHDQLHEPMRDYFSQTLVNEAVKQGLMSWQTGQQLLPVLDLIYDKIDPCS